MTGGCGHCWATVAVMWILSVGVGCGTVERAAYYDVREDQPWVGPDQRAIGLVATHETYMNRLAWLEWQVNAGHYLDSRRVTARAQRYLERQGVWEELVERLSYAPERIHAVNASLVIVALEPTVILIGPGRSAYHPSERALSVVGHQHPAYEREDGQIAIPISLIRGFKYGTTVPFDPEPQWFSPDMREGPKPVEFEDGVGIIKVPWGRLELRRDGDRWAVDAVE